MTTSSLLNDVSSSYLCPKCKNPLYFHLTTEEDVCTNENCSNDEKKIIFINIQEAIQLKKEIVNVEKELDRRLIEFDHENFIHFLFKKRAITLEPIFSVFKISFGELSIIDDLLLKINQKKVTGKINDALIYEDYYLDYSKYFEIKAFLEDVENKRYLISEKKEPYILKYWKVFMQFYEAIGIVSDIDKKISDVFHFTDIDSLVNEKVELEIGQDWGKYFQQLFPLIIRLGYIFEYRYFTALQHRYDPSGIDIASFIGLWLSLKTDHEKWSYDGIKSHYTNTSQGYESYTDFQKKYISSTNLSPIILDDGSGYLIDKKVLLIYFLYLMGRNNRVSNGQNISGGRMVAEKKEELGLKYEDVIREELTRVGYRVPGDSITVREDNEEHEYDVIAVKESCKTILLGEAKYRDFSPSSITGINLLHQELFDDDRLLDWVDNEKKKYDFFLKHKKRFKQELNLTSDIDDYDILCYVITKHVPLISKYKNINVIDYFSFNRLINTI